MRGILTVLSQGCKWRAIDRPEARWNSVYQYYRRWVRQGVFTQLFSQIELPLQGFRRFLDFTHVKALLGIEWVFEAGWRDESGAEVGRSGRLRGCETLNFMKAFWD